MPLCIFSLYRTWVCSIMCLTCPHHLFTSCISSDVSDDHSTLSQQLHLFMHSWPPTLTSAMPYLREPRSLSPTLQRVMNVAARVVIDTRKFDHGLTRILHDDLHWLDVADRVTYKLGVIMHRCRHGKALQYLVNCCTPVTDVVGRQRLG